MSFCDQLIVPAGYLAGHIYLQLTVEVASQCLSYHLGVLEIMYWQAGINACLVFRVSSHHNGPCFYVALQ